VRDYIGDGPQMQCLSYQSASAVIAVIAPASHSCDVFRGYAADVSARYFFLKTGKLFI
jgi:hypothetical protein